MERKTQIKGIRKGLAGVLLGALALANPAQAQEGWFNLQPAYNLKTESPTLRLEGGATLDKKFDVYGFLDLDSNKEGSADLDNYFGKLRFTYSLGDLSDKLENVGIAAEYTTASGMEDIIRPQLTYKTSLFKDNSTTFRFSPCDINGEGGPALNLFSYQQINKDINNVWPTLLITRGKFSYIFNGLRGFILKKSYIKLRKQINGFSRFMSAKQKFLIILKKYKKSVLLSLLIKNLKNIKLFIQKHNYRNQLKKRKVRLSLSKSIKIKKYYINKYENLK